MNRRTFLATSTAFAAMSRTASAHPPEIVDLGIVGLGGTALAEAIRTKKLSAVEVMTAYLNHIERFNPAVNAIVALQDRAGLLAEARARDEDVAKGRELGPLHGLPQAVKDLQPVKGIRSTRGSPLFKDTVPTADSIMVERLRKAGAIFIGKTNTPEFGLGSQTYNQVYGITRNAYDASKTSGGSSGGAASALALRMLPVADGSDNGGSLRNPAGWNNVYGFRVSQGRVPVDGPEIWYPSMGVGGPMARSVRDLALLLSVQVGYHAKAPLSIRQTGADITQPLDADMKGKRIAWWGDYKGELPFEPGVLDVCRNALKVFQDLGCTVEEAAPDYPLEKVWKAWTQLRAWQSGGSLLAYYNDPAKRALMKPEAIYEVESGQKLSAYDLNEAAAVRAQWYQAVRVFFEKYDYVVAPTAQVFAFDAETHWPSEVAGRKMTSYHEWMKVVVPITMAGIPALAVPAGFSPQGQSMGVQIAAPNHGELACLQLAHAYDMATRWPMKRPPPVLVGEGNLPQ